MKLKTVYILFNAVIVLSFALIFLLPLAMLGPDYFAVFASKNWLAGVLFAITLILINGYFLANWKLFHLLEAEDWHGLIRLLERRLLGAPGRVRGGIVGGGRLRMLRMLIDAYLVTSQLDRLRELEARLREDAPAALNRFVLPLGIPYLLREQPVEAEKYFGRFLQERAVAHRPWVRWNYAFALLQQGQVSAAKTTLLQLLEARADPVLRLLAVYLLASLADEDPAAAEAVARERSRLRRRYSPQRWRRLTAGKHIQMILLTPTIHSARDWLLNDAAPGPAPAEDGGEKTVH